MSEQLHFHFFLLLLWSSQIFNCLESQLIGTATGSKSGTSLGTSTFMSLLFDTVFQERPIIYLSWYWKLLVNSYSSEQYLLVSCVSSLDPLKQLMEKVPVSLEWRKEQTVSYLVWLSQANSLRKGSLERLRAPSDHAGSPIPTQLS